MRDGVSLAIIAFLPAGRSYQAMQVQVPVKAEIVGTGDGYQLLRAGQPYAVHGPGMSRSDIARLAAHGGNSIRTWTTRHPHQDTLELLDGAYAHGVTVALGLPMRPERRCASAFRGGR